MTTNPIELAGTGDLNAVAVANRTDCAFTDNVTLQELIELRVDENFRQPAVWCDHDPFWGSPVLSYGELNERANQVAHLLRECGVGPDRIVGLMVDRSFAMIVGILGILKAGGAYLPLQPADPPDRIRYVLQDAGVDILLVHGTTEAKAPSEIRVINLEQKEIYTRPSNNPPRVNQASDLAYVIYTSGSTGRPKGVMIEHRSVVNRLEWMQRAYPLDHRDVVLQKTSYCFDVSVWELFWWAIEGASLCFLLPGGERNPHTIVEAIRKHQVSVMHFVPSMLNVFLEYVGAKRSVLPALGSLRRIFASGEALSASHVRKFNQTIGAGTAARLTNLYGPTEATVDVTYFDCPDGEISDCVPIGKPIQNIRACILRDGREMNVGEVGELCIAGVGLARGYLHNPVLTQERFVDNPVRPGERIYRTGDLARWLPDGNIEYLGREDGQVKIRGLRIELGEIENTILEYPGIADCVATIRKFSDSVILIVAYLVCKEDLDLDVFKRHLQAHLPDYMVPHHFERIDQVPLTANGKADRKALPEPSLCGPGSRGSAHQ